MGKERIKIANMRDFILSETASALEKSKSTSVQIKKTKDRGAKTK
jgi:hypothetical protein